MATVSFTKNMKLNKEESERLLNIIESKHKDRFENMIFVLTGGLDNYTRDEAEKIIESFGGKTSSSVSKKTTYVLAGEGGGSKLTKAQELGINIISEQDFINMIK